MGRERKAPERLAEAPPSAKRKQSNTGSRKRKSDSIAAKSPAKKIQRTALSQNEKIKLFGEYSVLLASERSKGDVAALAKQYGVERKYPSVLYDKIMHGGMDGTDGRAGRQWSSKTIDKQGAEEIRQLLEKHNYELTYDQMADLLPYARSTIADHCRNEGYREVLGQTCPLLSDKHKADRLDYSRRHKRNTFNDFVDVDEKWFYAYRRVKKKVPKGVTTPRKRVQSKRFIPKVMILTAIARPRPEYNFNGLVGMWRVAVKAVAKNNSKNRDAGTEISVDVNMDGKQWRKMAGLVFRAIRTKMHWADEVGCQWDNAPAHRAKKSETYIKGICKARHGGPDIRIESQPAKSPDMNANDLGFYNSIDSKIPNPRPFDCDKLFKCCEKAWEEYDTSILDKIFDSRSRILKEVIRCKGDNNYKMPRSNKK